VLKSATRTVYFAGDTGYSPVFREIGARFGGVDLAILPIGAYQPRWLMKVVHMNPAEAVQAHLDVEARTSVGCHFGTFRLADEPLEEPPALLAQELAARQIDPQRFLALANGESIDI
jgi:L-ascorbate metabolism protein UlaG (beta-lactamase superfamily)